MLRVCQAEAPHGISVGNTGQTRTELRSVGCHPRFETHQFDGSSFSTFCCWHDSLFHALKYVQYKYRYMSLIFTCRGTGTPLGRGISDHITILVDNYFQWLSVIVIVL